MPELPEVQTIVGDLNRKILGRRIAAFWSDTPRILRILADSRGLNADSRGKYTARFSSNAKLLNEKIKNCRINKIIRLGKNIVFHLSKDKILVIHPKLTGHLLVGKWKKKNGKWPYIRAAFTLDNGLTLGFSDVRKFGKIMFGDSEKILALPDLKNLGPDALSVDFRAFKNAVSSEKRKIKLVPLDQEVIAGIGNIYSDEALWMAKIHPFTPANKLTEKQLKILFVSIKKVLKKSLRVRGSSLRNYRDTEGREGGYIKYRKVYNREGLPCFRCKTKIVRVKMGVRSAHFCPKCQNL